jgi:hypothetical protein
MAIRLYQIFYDDATRAALDAGFTPLDNRANERPDWREYWPIRRYLLSQPIEDGDYLGFFSPKFGQKTGLSAEAVKTFMSGTKGDVASFSPFFDQNAFFVNSFEQGDLQHPGFMRASQDFLDRIGLPVELERVVHDHSITIFANFFVAKGRFWKRWLELNEKLFRFCEEDGGELARRLNERTTHDGGSDVALKVFLMERMAAVILDLGGYSTAAYDPIDLPKAEPRLREFVHEMMICDALKSAFRRTGFHQYMEAFLAQRNRIFEPIFKAMRGE